MSDAKDKEKALKILEEHYKTIKDQQSSWDFFLNTAEYVKFIKQNKQFSESLKNLGEQQRKAYEAFNRVDNKAIKELENASKTITDSIKKLNINLSPLNNTMKELQQYNAGGILSSIPKVHALDNYLFDIARHLKESGFNDVIKRFEDENKKIKNIYGNFTFSQTLPLRDRVEEELEIKRKTEIWGAWEDLPFVERIFFDDVDIEKELKEVSHKDKLKKWELLNYLGVKAELKHMREYKKSDNDLVFFKISDFKNKLDRIHKFLITELLTDKEEQAGCSFDESDSVLVVNGQKVKFRKHTEQYHTLRIIFEDSTEVEKEWFFSEIGEKLDAHKGYKDKSFHNYISAIKKRVAVETGIKDLLMTTNQSVRINKKYLK
jgi:hypothetical protein